MSENSKLFVVLFQGRSGSTWLIESLNSHPQITARGEVLIALKSQRQNTQEEWITQFVSRQITSGEKIRGFKTKLSDVVNTRTFKSTLLLFNARIIHLERRNLLKQAVSWIRSEKLFKKTKDYNLRKKEDALGLMQIEPEQLSKCIAELEVGRNELNKFLVGLDLETLRLDYESLLQNTQACFDDVLKFLGVEQHRLLATSLKATDDNLEKAVANFCELRSHLKGTRYSSMIEESEEFRARLL